MHSNYNRYSLSFSFWKQQCTTITSPLRRHKFLEKIAFNGTDSERAFSELAAIWEKVIEIVSQIE